MHPIRSTALILLVLLGSASAFAAGDHGAGHHAPAGAPAIGKPGVAASATRTVEVDMSDAMRFTPARIDVKQGETVRIVVRNSGALKHELVLGTEADLLKHYEAMKKHPDMAHAEPNMVTLAPGQTGEVVWQFTTAGQIDFGCLQPGHYDLGMKGVVRVARR